MKVFWSSCLLHAIAVLVLSIDLSSSLDSGPVTSNKPDDKLALVAFKDLVTKDPFGVLNSWNDSLHFCEWSGIKCSRRHRERVTALELVAQELEGRLSPDIGKLSFLKIISLDDNKFTGAIPASLSNASRLEFIHLALNQFSGSVPMDLGRLQHLSRVSFYSNLLGTSLGDDLNFINYLTNCTKLEYLDVGGNKLYGSIPNGIGKLKSLTAFFMDGNKISGPIPTSLGNLTQLTILMFSGNELHGSIPTGIGDLKSLHWLDASQNQISGPIPTSLCNLTQLTHLVLSGNELYGSIPTVIGNLKSLHWLDASQNRISGPIPTSLANLTQLELLNLSTNQLYGRIPPSLMHLPLLYKLNLSRNDLNGSIPDEVIHLGSLKMLDVSHNSLSGAIPFVLGYCSTLENLYMQGNFFLGEIPDKLSFLAAVYYLDLSNNKLSGEIPNGLGNNVLTYMNLSYNELEGPVPTEGIFARVGVVSVEGNIKLCGGSVELKLHPCSLNRNRKRLSLNRNRKHFSLNVAIPVIVVTLLFVLVLSFFIMFCRRRLQEEKPSSPSPLNYEYPRISYAELLVATIGFSADTLLGAGRYGTVYKGFLEQFNTFVAVKLFNFQERGASKSFLAECNALRNLRHRNLIKIVTCCSSVDFQGNDFKALVYEFIPNGSLEEWLHQRRAQRHEMRSPNFLQRLNIAIDVASALDYLHHHCQPAVVHCDLKPSNILLDDEMTAHLSDFGLAKVFSATNSSSQSIATSNMIKGSIGYIPPEYGMGGIVSIKGDVYSYGILLLEMFTGRRPTDDMFQEGRNLHNFATMALPGRVMNIMDPTMLLEDSGRSINIINQSDKQARIKDCLVSVLTLGVKCSAESPMNRLNMAQVVTELHHIKEYHQGTRIRQE